MARSTVAKGNAFRDLVSSHLAAAGFHVENEIRAGFKKADALAKWVRNDLDGLSTYLVEAKDYAGTLPLQVCTDFVTEYKALIDRRLADRAWLISKGQISPDGRDQINGVPGLKCFTFEEFQRNLLQVESYLLDLIHDCENSGIEEYYVQPHTEQDEKLSELVDAWLQESKAPPLAVISGYGKGKSTFARHLAAKMAQDAISNKLARIPLLIRLGDVIDVTGIDGLVGRVLASSHRAMNYHFNLFCELNRSGRFLILLDGFDEMKHGMTISTFERTFNELMAFDDGDSRVLILGRDTAFHNDAEFRSIILGRQTTRLGSELKALGRRECRTTTLREFNDAEIEKYVRGYFPLRARQDLEAPTNEWIDSRVTELLSRQFSELISRPVHAQMLCEISTDPETDIAEMTKLRLYEAFVHYLLLREVDKRGRDKRIPHPVRHAFNEAVAWWLWRQGNAGGATLDSIPTRLMRQSVGDLDLDYDDVGLMRELAAGLLVEKGGAAVYFGHRSIQEFLVASYLIKNGLSPDAMQSDPSATLERLNSEIADFIVAYFEENPQEYATASEWIDSVDHIRSPILSYDLDLLARLARLVGKKWSDFKETPRKYILGYIASVGMKNFTDDLSYVAPAARYIQEGFREVPVEGPMCLIQHVALQDGLRFSPHLPQILASWVPAQELASAIKHTLAGKSAISLIKKAEQPKLWHFLQAIVIERNGEEAEIRIDAQKVYELPENSMVLDDHVLAVDQAQIILKCGVLAFYRALSENGVSEKVIDEIRPFFNDPGVRGRVRPLIVETPRLRTVYLVAGAYEAEMPIQTLARTLRNAEKRRPEASVTAKPKKLRPKTTSKRRA